MCGIGIITVQMRYERITESYEKGDSEVCSLIKFILTLDLCLRRKTCLLNGRDRTKRCPSSCDKVEDSLCVKCSRCRNPYCKVVTTREIISERV